MKKVDFSDGKIVQNILKTAFPMLVAQMLHLLYNIVDRIYIGRIPGTGTAALGAVGLCFPMIILITGFTNMYGMGGAPLFSMELGKNDRKKAGVIMNTSFRLILLTGTVIIIVGELFAKYFLYAFGATDAELGFALPYLRIYLLGTLFSMISTGMNPYITAQGFAVIGMMTVTVGAVANLLLDPLFIFVLGMGVQGAAVATVLSMGLSCFVSLRFFKGRQNEFPLTLPSGTGASVSSLLPYAGSIMALGTAPFIMQCTNSLVSIACNNMLMRYGGATFVSVMTIITSVREILDTPVLAIGEGTSPVISYSYGARRPAEVRKAIKIMTAMGVSYTFVMWILVERFPFAFISIFSKDRTLYETAAHALNLYFLAFIFQSLQYTGQTTFKALNKKGHAVFFSLLRKAILVVPLTLLLPSVFRMGTDGVFVAEPVSNFIGGTACFVTMLLTVMPELKRMESGLAAEEGKQVAP